MSDARLIRIERTLRTLIAWLPQSVDATISRDEARRLLDLLGDDVSERVPGRFVGVLEPGTSKTERAVEDHGPFYDPTADEPSTRGRK